MDLSQPGVSASVVHGSSHMAAWMVIDLGKL